MMRTLKLITIFGAAAVVVVALREMDRRKNGLEVEVAMLQAQLRELDDLESVREDNRRQRRLLAALEESN
jgi:hypothetical protein